MRRQGLANGEMGAEPSLKAENCLQAVLPDSTVLRMMCLLHQKISEREPRRPGDGTVGRHQELASAGEGRIDASCPSALVPLHTTREVGKR